MGTFMGGGGSGGDADMATLHAVAATLRVCGGGLVREESYANRISSCL